MPNSEKQEAIKSMAKVEIAEITRLQKELNEAKKSLQAIQNRCVHDWVGQNDIYPHGTPRETFICSICQAEEYK